MRKRPEEAPAFKIGDMVCTTQERIIDYSDCDNKHGLYDVPEGSEGLVISEPNDFGLESRYAVRFFSVENYPCLVFHSKEIGPGHYIPESMLQLVSTENDPKEGSVDLDTLFD